MPVLTWVAVRLIPTHTIWKAGRKKSAGRKAPAPALVADRDSSEVSQLCLVGEGGKEMQKIENKGQGQDQGYL